ncbi:MAG: ABC transporter substrate-binding protein [Acidimicrobiales bacterium]|nr:ABC transporter substrate-binding protein [Acidimicrobiales bacterium]
MTESRRIVSLLPSATEILFDLGLGDHVVGVTFECDFPDEARSRRIVSTSALPEGLTPAEIDVVVKERMAAGEDLYRLDAGAFSEIDPTLVVTQDLCAVCAVDVAEVDDALAHLGCSAEVLTLDPMSLEEVIDSVRLAGATTGTEGRAAAIVADLGSRVDALRARVDGAFRRPTLVLEWTDPAFCAGHWVPDLVDAAGGATVLGRPGEHSVGVDWSEVAAAAAEVVLVAPCGYRLDGAAELAQQVIDAGRLPPDAEVWALDADAHIVRPGPRVVDGAEIIGQVLHPDRCGPPDPAHARRLR